MDALLNTTFTDEERFADYDVGATGGTITYTLVSPTGTTLVNAAAATDAGGGWYTYDLDGTTYLSAPGRYHRVFQGTAASKDRYAARPLVVGQLDGPLQTRLDLRQAIARHLGDCWTGTATSGSSSTLVDASLAGMDDEFRGGYVYLTGGTGRDQERRITDYVASTGTVTVAPNWSVTPDSTTRYEVHKRWRIADYHNALNSVIRAVAHHALLPITDESLTVTSATVYEYTIPAGFATLEHVYARDSTDTQADWQPLERPAPTRVNGQPDWDVVRGRRLLRLRAPFVHEALRLEGQMQPTELLTDRALLDVHPSAYVEYQAAALLLSSQVRGPQIDRDAMAQRVALWLQMARDLMPRGRMRGIRV